MELGIYLSSSSETLLLNFSCRLTRTTKKLGLHKQYVGFKL